MGILDVIREKAGWSDAGGLLPRGREAEETVAALMVLVAASDGGISPEENLRMVQLLQQRLGLSSVDALDLVTDIAGRVDPDTDAKRLTGELNRELSPKAKQQLMLMILEVIAADDEKDAGELRLLNELVDGLGITGESMDEVYERYFASRRNPRS
jgi:uncharacterized tellurite resistance protein B-like protein